MLLDTSSQGQLDIRRALTFFAAQYGLTQADLAKGGVRSGADASHVGAAAVGADVRGQQPALQPRQLRLRVFQARIGLVKLRLKLFGFRLGLVVRTLKVCVLRPHLCQVLAKDVRAAVFVDEFLKQFEWVHGWPVGLKAEGERYA